MAASPGLSIGVGVNPLFRYVLYGPGAGLLVVALAAYLPSP